MELYVVSYQNATKMSATDSKAVKKANTIQYIIHFTCNRNSWWWENSSLVGKSKSISKWIEVGGVRCALEGEIGNEI